MRILVIGGTSFVGRHMAQPRSTAARGHAVQPRADQPDVLPAAERLTGDRNEDLSALDGRTWDATIDVCAYVPRQVRTLLESLNGRGGHYVFISTISVFPDAAPENFTEDSPLREPAWDDELVMDLYGELKVACEQVAQELTGDRLLVDPAGLRRRSARPDAPLHLLGRARRRGSLPDGDAGHRATVAVHRRPRPRGVHHPRLEAGDVTSYNATTPMPAPTSARSSRRSRVVSGSDCPRRGRSATTSGCLLRRRPTGGRSCARTSASQSRPG